ncbi:2,5-diamino-6-(ribosylamino)-4(3H)-pyrimidinone 5'-phosphate reductase [Methanomicrobium sp. W14]|uniref:RibD family protein n=1 Tax=Methanomicrobium sp. W14 TaxID=2817839 RepID=UPI001AEA33B9|nr:dihydrofolate reductase family protein [Methanomicrobium sp. W14]MBP2132127.1 2,5-diamino-6-(ribosylamino)-4(3H)-pyrimidinone 5'-phosphate reductase [Methanomicrobium sp. W14]
MKTEYKRPHVMIMSEITVDGKLTLKKGASSKILMKYMDPKTDILLHKTRAEYDAIMVGSNTIRIDNSFLTVRYVEGENPVRVIPSSMGDIPPESNVLGKDAKTIIAVCKKAPQERVDAILKKGAEVLFCGEDRVSLPLLMNILATDYNIKTLMVEGGPTLNYYMLQDRLVDEIRLIHLPFIVGGADTPSLVGGMHIDSEEEMFHLALKEYYMCGSNLVTEYDVNYSE